MSESTTEPAAEATSPAPGGERPYRYSAKLANEIEVRWQEDWTQKDIFRAANPGEAGFDLVGKFRRVR